MSNDSEGASSVRSRIITKEDEEAEFIADSDIEDATSVVSLGTKQCIHTEEGNDKIKPDVSFLGHDSQPDEDKRGYIDEEIVRNVMKGADERLMEQKMNTTFNRNMKICAGLLGLTIFFLGIAIMIVDSNDRVDKTIKDTGTAYDFQDEGNFIDLQVEEGYSFWDEEIYLEPGVIFPPAILLNLVDSKKGRYLKEKETPFFFQVPFR